MIPGTQEFANMCFSRTKFTEQDILNLENHPIFEKERNHFPSTSMNMGGLIFPSGIPLIYTTYIYCQDWGVKNSTSSHLVREPESHPKASWPQLRSRGS